MSAFTSNTGDGKIFGLGDWANWFAGGRVGRAAPARFRAAFRQAVMLRGQLTGPELEAFVDSSIERFGPSLNNQMSNARSPEQMTDAIADFGRVQAQNIDDAVAAFRQNRRNTGLYGGEKDENVTATLPGGGTEGQPNKLRTRYVMGGTDTLQENWLQEMSDQSAARAFDWQTRNFNGDTSIYLRNQEHESMVLDSAMPRAYGNIDMLVGTFPVIPQFNGNMPDLLPYMVNERKKNIIENIISDGPNVSVALLDEEPQTSALSDKTIESILEPVIIAPPPMTKDITQGTSSSYINAFGMRNIYDTWRQVELKPPEDFSYPTKPNALQEIEYGRGFDYMESF